MKQRWLHPSVLLILAFGVLLGFTSWRAFFGYIAPDYRKQLAWEAPWIVPPGGAVRHAYFRKRIAMSARPEHAWLAVLAPGRMDLIVNGHTVHEDDDELSEGPTPYIAAYTPRVFDITPYLEAGINVIAVYSRISTFHQRAQVAVMGEYVEGSGRVTPIRSDPGWRVATRDRSLVSRGGIVQRVKWFAPKYDDGGWPYAVVGEQPTETLVRPLAFSPSLVVRPLENDWVWTGDATAPEGYFRLAIDLERRPRDAWLRLGVKRSYRLIVNGHPVVAQEHAIAVEEMVPARLVLHNIGPLLRPGRNVVGVQVSSFRGDRGVLLDGFVDVDGRGPVWFPPTRWKASSVPARGWETVAFDDGAWKPAAVSGRVMIAERRALEREVSSAAMPLPFRLRALGTACLVTLVALVSCLALWAGTAWLLGRIRDEDPRTVARWLPLTVVPPTLVLGIAHLLGFDARLPATFAYQPGLIAGSLAVLVVLHAGLVVAAAVARRRATPVPARETLPDERRRALLALVVVLGLTALGFWLRMTDLTSTSLGGDEVTAIRRTLGVLERGYPSMIVDGRVRPTLTSELVYFFKAITIGLFGPNAFGLRLHDVIFGTLTIPLMYWTGAQVHSRRAGFLAAALYTILPSTIRMTHYGRYPSQQLFFALLTFLLLWRALEGGRVRPRWFYGAIAAFIGTYLSWEGAAFYVPALTLGAIVLMRPDFRWMQNPHVWSGIGLLAMLVFFQLSFRLINQLEWRGYGAGAADVAPGLAFNDPFYDPTFYVTHFFLVESHHLLTLAFVLGIPAWFGSSRASRVLAFSGVTLLADLAMMTNLLDLHTWRYVYYVFGLLILNASIASIMFFDYLARLSKDAASSGRLPAVITRASMAMIVVGLLLFSTTFVVKLYNLPLAYAATPAALGRIYFPATVEGAEYVRQRVQPGDVVVATLPHVVQYVVGRVDYLVQFELTRPLLLGHDADAPIHRIASAPAILSESEFKELIAITPRVWLVATAETPLAQRVPETVRAQMRLVYEDVKCAVFISDTSLTPETMKELGG